MALDPSIPRPRRAVLAAAFGAAAASVAHALGRPAPVAASDPNDVVKNINNVVTAATSLENSANNADVLIGSSLGGGKGVYGYSASGTGVYAESVSGYGLFGKSTTYYGVTGQSASSFGGHFTSSSHYGMYADSQSHYGAAGGSISHVGVLGFSYATNQPAISGQAYGNATGVLGSTGFSPPDALPKTGVFGYSATDATSRGVVGQSPLGTGMHGFAGAGTPPAPTAKTGVYGRSDIDATAIGSFGYSIGGTGTRGGTQTGTALLGAASAAAGYGLRSIGRVSLQKASGVATIAAAGSSVTVTPGTDIIAGTFVILTPQADPGTRRIWATIDATANTITIHVSSAVTSSLKVAWLALG